MKIKGIDKFRSKIPAFSGKRFIIIPLVLFLVFSISLIIQFYFDILPTLIPSPGAFELLFPLFPVFGVALINAIGILLIYQVWYHRTRLKAKYGQLSYQKIFLSGFSGVVIISTLIIHNYLSIFIWQSAFWAQAPYSFYVIHLSSFFIGFQSIIQIISFLLSMIFLFFGCLLVYRAIHTFGFDYMAVVYLYFPEESELQDHEIYSVLRHPTYTAIILMSLGGVFFQLNLYSIIFFCIIFLFLYIHIHYVEEKELIQRFGDSFKEYRKNTPAFFVRPKKWGKLFKFLLGRE